MCSRFYGRRVPWPAKMFMALAAVPGLLFLGTLAAWLLWNALMPALFQLPVLTYWQMMGIMVLGRLLFGGRGPGRPGRFPGRPRHRDRDEWKAYMREKFRDGFPGEHPLHGHHDHPMSEDAATDPEKP